MRFCENCTDNINILILAMNSNCTPLGLLPKPFKEHFCWKNTLNWTQIRLQSHKHRMQFPQSLLQSVIYSCSSISGLCVVYFSTPYIAYTVAKETSVFKQQTIPTKLISEVIIGVWIKASTYCSILYTGERERTCCFDATWIGGDLGMTALQNMTWPLWRAHLRCWFHKPIPC